MNFQWLVPLDRSYEEARATVIKTLYGGPYDIGINDWSTVLTGESDKPKSVFGCEFGIVEASEAPRRLGRQTGYFKGNGYETPLTVWATETLPPVAFFLDYSVVREGAVENSPEGVIRLWTETRAEVSAVVSELMNRVLGGKYE